MGVLRVKLGAQFSRIDPSGFRIIGSLDHITRTASFDLTITCGSDSHPASDPHTLGRAYDVRISDLTPDQRTFVMREVMLDLQEAPDDAPTELTDVDMPNLATKRFYVQQESDHLHFQQRKNTVYP